MQLYWKETPTQVFSNEFWELSRNTFFVEDLSMRLLKTPDLQNISFRACTFIKKETQAKMFICEFCKIFQNIFRQKHLWMTAFCVYLWILRSFSGQEAALGIYLFHLQVAQFQPQHTVKKCFNSKKVVSACQAFILEE